MKCFNLMVNDIARNFRDNLQKAISSCSVYVWAIFVIGEISEINACTTHAISSSLRLVEWNEITGFHRTENLKIFRILSSIECWENSIMFMNKKEKFKFLELSALEWSKNFCIDDWRNKILIIAKRFRKIFSRWFSLFFLLH